MNAPEIVIATVTPEVVTGQNDATLQMLLMIKVGMTMIKYLIYNG